MGSDTGEKFSKVEPLGSLSEKGSHTWLKANETSFIRTCDSRERLGLLSDFNLDINRFNQHALASFQAMLPEAHLPTQAQRTRRSSCLSKFEATWAAETTLRCHTVEQRQSLPSDLTVSPHLLATGLFRSFLQVSPRARSQDPQLQGAAEAP